MTLPNNKSFTFEGFTFDIASPNNISFSNNFYETIYTKLYNKIIDGNCFPHVNCDTLASNMCGFDYYDLGLKSGLRLPPPSRKSSNKNLEKIQIAIQVFCKEYPLFVTFIQNCRFKAEIAISHAEMLINDKCNIKNFMNLKKIIGHFNKLNWTRAKDRSESQAGVSNLGQISEKLLEAAFGNLTDERTFFRVTRSEVKSWGDFVIMCLPNNLWLSVKSNFARERLLASGYSNDILAVGFFEDFTEFTSQVKIRNMQRAGFLCVYIPDVPVTDEQENNSTTTYQQTLNHYNSKDIPLPLNINGSQFIRRLSNISNDLDRLLRQSYIEGRLSVDF